MKKILSIFLVAALMLTGMTMFAFAEGAGTVDITLSTGDKTIYDTSDEFTVDITLNAEITKFNGISVALEFDSNVIALTDGNGTVQTEWNPSIVTVDSGLTSALEIKAGSEKLDDVAGDEGEAKKVIAFQIGKIGGSSPSITVEDGTLAICSINFKPVAKGETSIEKADDELYDFYYRDASAETVTTVYPTVEAKAVVVCATPTAPEVSEVAVTAPKSGSDATISYSFNDNSADTVDGDISELVVAIDGEEVDVEIAEKTFVVADEWVGKELTVGVKAKADREIASEAESFVWSDAVVVMPADDYAPEATVELEKVTIGKEVELDYVIDTYTEEGDASEYRWFVVEATDVETAIAAVEGAEALEGFTTPNPTFEKTIGETETKGKWAVVEVTAKEEIAGVPYPVNPEDAHVYYAAAEIKSVKSGGVQGGASLVTGTTETKPEVKPEEPGKEDPKPEEPGTEDPKPEEPKTDDPAGTANEAGAAAFTDVDKEAYAWAYDSIDALAKSGVIKGMTADSFGPELSTTNAQVIALVVRIAGLAAEEGATTDKVDAEHWVYKEMAAAQAAGILGVFGDEVDVEKATTREAAFTLLYNALKAAGVELNADAEDIAYSDAASIDENCKEAISALTKAGIINGMGDGTLAPKAEITRAQLAKILGLANVAK